MTSVFIVCAVWIGLGLLVMAVWAGSFGDKDR